jgi:hypothetical protein
MAGAVDPATTTTFTTQMDCIIAELDLINRQLDIRDHLISEMERRVSLLTRSVPLLPPPRVASPLPPNARAALPSPPPHVTAHRPLGRFPASDTDMASDVQRPRGPNITRRNLIDPLHGQRDDDAPTPRHLLHLRASLLDAPRRHGATAILVPPSPAPNAQPPPPPTAPKYPPATLPPTPTSGAAAFRPDWIGNAATASPSAPRLGSPLWLDFPAQLNSTAPAGLNCTAWLGSFFSDSAGLSSPGLARLKMALQPWICAVKTQQQLLLKPPPPAPKLTTPSPSSPAPSPPTATSFSGVTMGFSFWTTTTRLTSLLPTPEQISPYQCPKLQWRHVTRVCTRKEDNGYRTTLLAWDPG